MQLNRKRRKHNLTAGIFNGVIVTKTIIVIILIYLL